MKYDTHSINFGHFPVYGNNYRQNAERYLLKGTYPGEVLEKIFSNDFVGTCAGFRGDEKHIHSISVFLTTCCPADSYGSAEKFRMWQIIGGWEGYKKAKKRMAQAAKRRHIQKVTKILTGTT